MSFLAPLYVLGALGISLPILFHLIKRQPRGQRLFSSLMFLKPSPPTVTRRSRLDNLPLLLLRALALLLLAAAFARPFLRDPLEAIESTPGRRIVLLVDKSASMQRTGLWDQATKAANDLVDELRPTDQLAVVAFDRAARVEIGLEQSAALEPVARRDTAKQTIKQLQPSWAASDLGAALVVAADMLTESESVSETDAAEPTVPVTEGLVVLVSDMQKGDEENLKRLQSYSWPKEIRVEVRAVVSERKTNAVASLLEPLDDELSETSATAASAPSQPSATRVRVSNSADAAVADFSLAWQTITGETIDAARTPVHVGPGESRVVRMPEPPRSIDDVSQLRLVLSGDDHEFDNVRFVARSKPLEQQLMFMGPESGEPRDSLLYYLQRAPLGNRRRNVTIVTSKVDSLPAVIDASKIPLVVINETVTDAALASLESYMNSGGSVLWVLDKNADRPVAQRALQQLSKSPDLLIAESETKDYAMWSRIEFTHPLFSPFSDPRYNDFTKIRFWNHRHVTGLSDAWKTVVAFDNDDVALAQVGIGKGSLWLMSAGWQPSDSQLALSTKFVPLIDGLFTLNRQQSDKNEHAILGQPLPFPPSATAKIVSEANKAIDYRTEADSSAIGTPGFYKFIDADVAQPFAVNLAESESQTQPMSAEELERYGIPMGTANDSVKAVAVARQQRDVELEGRQRLWRWILLGALGLIAIESALSGYLRRRAPV